jgi:hypothetical protein
VARHIVPLARLKAAVRPTLVFRLNSPNTFLRMSGSLPALVFQPNSPNTSLQMSVPPHSPPTLHSPLSTNPSRLRRGVSKEQNVTDSARTYSSAKFFYLTRSEVGSCGPFLQVSTIPPLSHPYFLLMHHYPNAHVLLSHILHRKLSVLLSSDWGPSGEAASARNLLVASEAASRAHPPPHF